MRLAAGYLILVVAVACMLGVTLVGMQAQGAVRVLLQSESRWSVDVRDAMIHLQTFSQTGDPQEWREFESSLTYPRAVRRPLEVVLEFPGDADRLEDALSADPLTSGNIPALRRFTQLFAGRDQTREALGLWLEADRQLQRIEGVAAEIRQSVDTAGPGSPESEALREELDRLHHALMEVDTRFGDVITIWVTGLERSVRIALVASSLVLAILGTLLMWVAGSRLRRSRAAVEESEERFRQVTEAIREVFWLTDLDKSRMLYVSPGYERIWKRSRKELMADPSSWLDPVCLEDRQRVEAAVEGQVRGEYDVEYRIDLPDGGRRWIRDRAFPVRDRKGRITRLAGIAEDVTHEKEMERELLQSGRVRAMAQLSGVVGHELNNLLTVVQSHAQLALADVDAESPVAEDLRAVTEAADGAAELARKLLSISRQQLLVPRPIHLERLLGESREMIRAALPEGVHFSLETPVDLPPVHVDPGYLREAISAFVAYSGSDRPDVVWIELDRTESGDPVPVHGGTLPPGEFLRLVVGNNSEGGVRGEPDELFAPMGVQEAVSEGLVAFGLPAAQGILEQSGGGVQLATEAGSSRACFLIYLPVWGGRPPRAP
ncbi:MAG: hybrid sensor histidine kinase/response regulator [Gemmatimonadales bacterium]|nr:MAG: hybrid sensor histidine kinase/response regulator [Gemmatimonadales bacterium]